MRNKNELNLFTMDKKTEKDLDSFGSVFRFLILLAFLDVISTIVFLHFGYSESMLMAISFMRYAGIFGLVTQKIIILTLMFFFLFGVYIISRPLSLFLMGTMAIGQAFIVLSNFVLVITGHICLFDILRDVIGGIL